MKNSKDIEEAKQLPPNCTPIEELFEDHYGKRGTPEREAFEVEAQAFMIAEMLKEERRLANMTQ